MKEKKYDVTISEPNDGWGYFAPLAIYCNPMTVKEIQDYLDIVAKNRTIPIDSCLYQMNTHIQHCGCIDVLLSRNNSNIESTKKDYSSYMKISVQMTNSRKCPREKCLENIKYGKCTDKFMIDIIGKQFFADKYAKQK